MTMPMPLGLAPYVSPEILISAPTGIDFSTLGPVGNGVLPTPQANNAEVWNVCMRATSMADQYVNQVLRATIDTEVLHGPDYRVSVGPQAGGRTPTPYAAYAQGNARLIMSRWPVLEVNQIQVGVNGVWPRQWTTVPTGYAEPEQPPYGIYNSFTPCDDAYGGQAILMAPGYVNWCYGRNGYILQINYTNGWPHTALASPATAGSTVLSVTDTTGWYLTNYSGNISGATGVIQDLGWQETATCTSASTTAGPGNLYLSSETEYPHQTGTIFTTLPNAVQQACILFAAAQALVRGATSTVIHNVSGGAQGSEHDMTMLNSEAELLLHPYKRTI